MTTITAKVVADSTANGVRLTTFELVYPAFFHQDFLTHRAFSRNSSSTRAIPISRLLRSVLMDIASPIHWGRNQAGMVAGPPVTKVREVLSRAVWTSAACLSVGAAWLLNKIGVHKQVGNMVLWPYMHFKTLVTATDYENFFTLRDHGDARPEIQKLAQVMKEARDASVPRQLNEGQWHLPYVTDEERAKHDLAGLLMLSAARCASVSYDTVDGKRMDMLRASRIFDKLINSEPMHASPIEHQATPDSGRNRSLWGNFYKWKQYRQYVAKGIEI